MLKSLKKHLFNLSLIFEFNKQTTVNKTQITWKITLIIFAQVDDSSLQLPKRAGLITPSI